MFEFQENWRIPAIVKEATGCSTITIDDCAVVKHHFYDENFIKYSRSYLRPEGHPWAALVLFDALLVAYLRGDISQIHLGHELAADEGNGVYINNGTLEVNHQYDKSSAFVDLAAEYIRNNITTDITICAPLNKLSELEISKVFCLEPALQPFHSLFLSCNEPINKCEWCLKCEKCAFIFLLMSAWLGDEHTGQIIFSDVNMLQQHDRIPVFLSLLGSKGHKPFDCVGTVEEVKAVVDKIIQRCEALQQPLPVVIAAMLAYTSIVKESGAPLKLIKT